MAAPSNKQETQHNNSLLVDDQSNSSASIITQDNCVAPWKHTGCYLPPPPSSQQQQQQQQHVECSLQTTSNSSLDTNEYAGGASTTSAWCAATSTNVPHSWQDVTLITHQPPPGFVLHSLSYQSSVVQATGGDHEVGEIGIGGLSHLKSHGLRSADGEENDETRLKMFSAVNEEQEERMQYQFVAGDDTTAPHPAGTAEPPTNYGFNNYFSQMINSAYADESDRNELHGTTNILDFNLNSCSNNNIEMMALDGEEGNLVPSQAADFYASQQYHQLSLDYNSDANIVRNGYVHVDAGYNMMHDYASLVVSPAASLFEATCNEHKMHYPTHFASQSGLSPPSKLPLRKRNRNANATAELDCNLQPPKRSLSRGSIDSDCMNKSNRTINATCDNITNGKDLQMGAPQKYCEEGGASTNTKRPRARQGVANDPQSVAARLRRERISERLKVLQQLVPNGSKVDLVTMLEKAISYVKFLQLQLKVLTNDEYWPTETSLNKEGVKIEEAFNAKTGEEDSTFPEIIITLKKEDDALINSEEQ